MKILKLITSALALLLCVSLNAQTTNNTPEKTKKSEVVIFAVGGMHGEHCKMRIENNIGFEKGVKDLVVDLKSNTVTITYNSKKTTEEQLKTAIEKLGYSCKIPK